MDVPLVQVEDPDIAESDSSASGVIVSHSIQCLLQELMTYLEIQATGRS